MLRACIPATLTPALWAFIAYHRKADAREEQMRRDEEQKADWWMRLHSMHQPAIAEALLRGEPLAAQKPRVDEQVWAMQNQFWAPPAPPLPFEAATVLAAGGDSLLMARPNGVRP